MAYKENEFRCRVCLTENDNMKHLTADYLICGEIIQISSIITTCTSVQIINDDVRFPKFVCDTCLRDVNTGYCLKKRLEYTTSVLKAQLEAVQKVQPEENGSNLSVFENLSELSSHHKFENPENESYFLCTKCPVKFATQGDLNHHIKSEHNDPNFKVKYQCNFCGKPFRTEMYLNKHMYTHTTNTLRAMRRFTKHSTQENFDGSRSEVGITDSAISNKEETAVNQSETENSSDGGFEHDENFSGDENSSSDEKLSEVVRNINVKVKEEKNEGETEPGFCAGKKRRMNSRCKELAVKEEESSGSEDEDFNQHLGEKCFSGAEIKTETAPKAEKSDEPTARSEKGIVVCISQRILKYSREKNEEGLYECMCCPEVFEALGDLHEHTRSHSSYACKICGKTFTILSNLRRHLKAHRGQKFPEQKTLQNLKGPRKKTQKFLENAEDNSLDVQEEDLEGEEGGKFKCISCGVKFQRRKQLSAHLKTHKEFGCMVCGAKFSFATNLRKHIRWHKQPKDEIRVWKPIPAEKRTCDICFKVFKFRPSMLKHRKAHECSEKRCKYCDASFPSSVTLYKHMEASHEHEKNVVCAQCGKKFFREVNLRVHMIVHSGRKPYLCEVCGVSFALSGNLISHRRLHTGARPYKCSTCGRGFAQQAALRSHEAGHSNRKEHVCPECGAAFSRAGAMRNHRKRHLGARPFACSMCDKRFTFSSERKRHMRIHTGEKNHVCDLCGKAFNRMTNLTVHRRTHTGETPHVCSVCGKGFVQAHCLRTHLNTHRRLGQQINSLGSSYNS